MCPGYWYVPKDKRGTEMHFCKAQEPMDTISESMLPYCKSERCVECHWYQHAYGRRPLETVQKQSNAHSKSSGGGFGILVLIAIIAIVAKWLGVW